MSSNNGRVMELRARSDSVSYSDDRSIGFTTYSLNSKPASKWKDDDVENFGIKVTDVQDMFPHVDILPNEAKSLVVPEWKDGNLLLGADVKSLPYSGKMKTLIAKLRKIHM